MDSRDGKGGAGAVAGVNTTRSIRLLKPEHQSDGEEPQVFLWPHAAVCANVDTRECLAQPPFPFFFMGGFQPRPEYLRELRRYGILPEDHPDDAPVDPYALDQQYWRSQWYVPQ